MTTEEQLAEWVKGNSVHDVERDECCPDFSCCNPGLLAPLSERQLFADRPGVRDEMLMSFLRRCVSRASNDKVYIAGERGYEEHEQ